MPRSFRTNLIDRKSGRPIQASVHDITEGDLQAWSQWRYSENDDDRDWKWAHIWNECRSSSGVRECFAATAANDLQGLLALDLTTKVFPFGGVITIDYLASNPLNRPPELRFKHVGASLVAFAVARSLEVGAQGALWLESLPAAETFYENIGFERQAGLSSDGNAIYVLSPEDAKQFLENMRSQSILET